MHFQITRSFEMFMAFHPLSVIFLCLIYKNLLFQLCVSHKRSFLHLIEIKRFPIAPILSSCSSDAMKCDILLKRWKSDKIKNLLASMLRSLLCAHTKCIKSRICKKLFLKSLVKWNRKSNVQSQGLFIETAIFRCWGCSNLHAALGIFCDIVTLLFISDYPKLLGENGIE